MSKDYFHISEVDHQELMGVLLHHFGSCHNIERFLYKYQKKDSGHFLKLTTDKTGKIRNIALSKNFPKEELIQIENEIINNILVKHDVSIGQIVGFCSEKVEGYFRYKNLFQIIPVPEEAPRPNVGYADHPFLLQFSYEPSPDMMVDITRRRIKAVLYTRLLNLLLNRHIKLGSRYSQHNWVVNKDKRNRLYSEWKQIGYAYEGYGEKVERYTEIQTLNPIERVPYQQYYSELPAITFEGLKLPDNIEKSLDIVFGLNKSDWERFYRACTWYSQYEYLWQESSSSAFIALVTSLECLIEKPKPKICKCCNQPIYSIKKHFKGFLEKYVPFINQVPETEVLYNIRSELSHGAVLLRQDLEPWNFLMSAKADEERNLQRVLNFIVGVAIYNWLMTHPQQSSE